MPKKTTPARKRSGDAAPPRKRDELPFQVRRSAIQGRGVFATRRLRPGQRILEYVGEHISRDEGDRRYDDEHMGRHHTFLFALEDGSVIDAAVGGNDARFINHSCDPNCQAIEEDGRIFIEAIRNVQPGAELVYDYAYERTDDHTEEDERLYVCRCGARNCRGSILAPRKTRSSARKTGKKR